MTGVAVSDPNVGLEFRLVGDLHEHLGDVAALSVAADQNALVVDRGDAMQIPALVRRWRQAVAATVDPAVRAD